MPDFRRINERESCEILATIINISDMPPTATGNAPTSHLTKTQDNDSKDYEIDRLKTENNRLNKIISSKHKLLEYKLNKIRSYRYILVGILAMLTVIFTVTILISTEF